MKSSKRAFALLMTLIFALSSVFSFSATLAGAADFSDVADTNAYFEAITTLVEDGIINGYEDGTFKPDNTITRAEFSKLLATASAPSGTLFNATTTQFSDVADSTSSSAWAIPYIAYAVGVKAVNGYEDGTFRPTNTVTYGEAVKMIVCTLGYEPVVNKTLTPWYQGYVDIAAQIGLSKSAFAQGDTPAPRGLVAQLVFNMRECKPLVQTGLDINGNPTWGTGDSIKDEYKDGIVLGVIDYALNGASVKKSEVLIGNQTYGIGKYSVDTLKDFVGYSVEFSLDARGDNITNIRKQSGENELITVEAEMIASVSDNSLAYYKNEDDEYDNKTTNISLDNMYVVYNGVPVNPADIGHGFDISDNLEVEDGKITFLSNDGNAKDAEVAFVESYVTYLANTPSTSDEITTIMDQYPTQSGNTTALVLDADDVASVKRVTQKGGSASESTLSAISKGNVVSVALPYGSTSENAKVIFSTATVTKGEVKEMTSDYSYIKIGNEEYKVSPYFEKIKKAGVNVEFSINDIGKFYLDRLGRIVFFEKTQSTNPYALAVRYKKNGGMNAQYALDVYTSGTAGTTLYPLKPEVRVNNGSSMNAADVIELLENKCESKEVIDGVTYIIQPIRYSTSTYNGETVISAIECMADTNGAIVPYPVEITSNSDGILTASKSGSTTSFKDGSATRFSINSSSVVFAIPEDITKVKDYRKYTYSSFTDNKSYCVAPYDVEKSTAKVALYYLKQGESTLASIKAGTPVYLIESIGLAEDDNGQPVKKIHYYKAGSTTSENALTDYDSDFDNLDSLKPGDVAKFAVNDDDEITMIQTVYANGSLTTESASWVSGFENFFISKDGDSVGDKYYQVMMGTVYDVDEETNNNISIIPELVADSNGLTKVENRQAFTLGDSVGYYKYESKSGKFRTMTSSGGIKSYEDFGTTDPTQASKVIAIVMQKKVTAVYILN